MDLPDPCSRQEMGLRGAVKAIDVRTETIGSTGNSNNVEQRFFFNQAGQTIRVEACDRELLAEIRTYVRDPKTNLMTIRIEENMAVDRTIHDLHVRGKIICELDAAGRVLTAQRVDWMGELHMSWEREYDPAGRLIAERKLNPDGEILSLCLSNFEGRTQGRREFYGGTIGEDTDLEQAEETEEIEFDDAGRPLVTLINKPKASQIRVEHTYDAAGRPLTETHIRNTQQVEQHNWTYDPYGNILTHTWKAHRDSSSSDTYTYTYDGQGNWIERRHTTATTALGDVLPGRTEITRRVITYFS